MPPLGFITVAERSATAHAAHAASQGLMLRHALPPFALARGEAVRLFDFFSLPQVAADVGLTYTRIHQQTGSCVWAGGTNALVATIAAQCAAGRGRAFLPFTLPNYAASRHAAGSDSPGEGSLGSTFAASLARDGVSGKWVGGTDSMPSYSSADGISVTRGDELAFSSIRTPAVRSLLPRGRDHLLGSATPAGDVGSIRSLVGNGYGVSFACDRFVGRGVITKDRVLGRWDSAGGHQQSILAYEEHADLGPIYWAQNNWPASTYPRCPSGAPACGVWVREDDVTAALSYNAEVYGLSHLSWFEPTPQLLQWVF